MEKRTGPASDTCCILGNNSADSKTGKMEQAPGCSDGMIRRLQEAGFSIGHRSSRIKNLCRTWEDLCGDIIACENEEFPEDEPLLLCVMRNGTRIGPPVDLQSIQQHARQQLERIPEGCFHGREHYIVSFSQRLQALLTVVRRRIHEGTTDGARDSRKSA